MTMSPGDWHKFPLDVASSKRRVLNAYFDLLPLSRLFGRGQASPGRFPEMGKFRPLARRFFCPYLYFWPRLSAVARYGIPKTIRRIFI